MSGFIEFPNLSTVCQPSVHNNMLQIIKEHIQKHQGMLPFNEYMQTVLYDESGFYNQQDFRRHFTTAPELSPLFGRTLANQIAQIAQQLGCCDIVELGAGSGQLAADLMSALAQKHHLPANYFILETSTLLQNIQKQIISQRLPEFAHRLQWIQSLPNDFRGIIIANEVLDALPVHCFVTTTNAIQERYVTCIDDQLSWTQAPATHMLDAEKDYLLNLRLPKGYQSEINLNMRSFLSQIAKQVDAGVFLIIDYGYGKSGYYHPDRKHGTLTCFNAHQKNTDPLFLPGMQDISVHVDFSRIADIACDLDFDILGYTNQASFLLDNGLIDIAQSHAKPLSLDEQLKITNQLKTLTFPTEMGECVKVMAMSKNFSSTLQGFTSQDRRRDL